MWRTTLAAVMGLLVPALYVGGCGEAEELADCGAVCERYADCFDESYDVGGCIDRCEDNADENEEFEDDLARCEACIDDQSCIESAFACGPECLGIVP